MIGIVPAKARAGKSREGRWKRSREQELQNRQVDSRVDE
jgi:hypothetical protein